MEPEDNPKPLIRKSTARACYLRLSAEWMTGRRRVPFAVLAEAEEAARAVLARHACQPKASPRRLPAAPKPPTPNQSH